MSKRVSKKKKTGQKRAAASRAAKPKIILLRDPASKLVYIELALRTGSVMDPVGKAGTFFMTAGMLLRGTKKRPAAKFHEELDQLGAEIYLGRYMESLRIIGVVLAENLDKFLRLYCEMLKQPAFDEQEFRKVKQQLLSGLRDELGDDDDVADRRFQELLLKGHKYGRITSGSIRSVESIELDDIKNFYSDCLHGKGAVFGATGDFDSRQMRLFADKAFAALPKGTQELPEIVAPEMQAGRRLVIVDKPDRSQSQIMIGGKGLGHHDPDYFPMLIANHVFGGGSFSAWLMREIREKRGWSYGAYAYYRSAKKPLYYAMNTTPSNKDTVPAVKLMLKLFQDLARKGISKSEFDFAKSSLLNQSAFLQDTWRKRLSNKVNESILDLPDAYFDNYRDRLKRITHKQVQAAIQRCCDPKRLFLLVLGTAKEWENELTALPGVEFLGKQPYDEEPLE